ncbi:MAG: hydroxyacid dehydrogenase [Burkholderiales bacterium]|jgi:FAD/FMN-containing dehydrogenase|nr:hydroxyacid dehydrogenase [Burkholderiales bacterium]
MENSLLAKFVAIVGQNNIITDPAQQQPYLADWRGRYQGKAMAVVKPQTTTQVVQLVNLCNVNNITIIPQGGNTSLSGAATPLNQSTLSQVIINLSMMNKILSINKEDNSINVEAGCTLAKVIDYAEANGRYFPLNIAAKDSCQIGGNIATNAGGIHVIKYGMIRDMVLGLEVVLPNGEIFNSLNNLRKNNSYLDLKQLFIGSEGTLGIITRAILKLYPKPVGVITGLISVKTIFQAIDILNRLYAHFSVCAFEIIGKTMQSIYNTHFAANKFPLNDNWLILFELETNNENNTLNILSEVLNDVSVVICDSMVSRQNLWHIRENLPLAEKIHGIAIKHDISLPISQIELFIKQNEKSIKDYYPDAQIIIFGHLGDGNLHYNVQLATNEQTIEQEVYINKLVYTDALSLGGSVSAEHGIGQLKTSWYKLAIDPVGYNLAKQIKQLLDPKNIFNPKKIFSEIIQ